MPIKFCSMQEDLYFGNIFQLATEKKLVFKQSEEIKYIL